MEDKSLNLQVGTVDRTSNTDITSDPSRVSSCNRLLGQLQLSDFSTVQFNYVIGG